jgi:hypothetical protein
MNLKSLSDSELLNGVRSLRANERKLDRQIVEYICEIETRRLYAEIGYPNIIDWLVKDLGYSESSAYRRVMAARAIRAVPEAAVKIEEGSLTLVTLAKVQSVIRIEEKRTGERVSLETRSTIIAQTENKTLRETVRIAAEHFPEAMQTSGSQIYSTQISLTDEQLALLERVRELKSHSSFGASLGEIVAALANEYLDRNDPLRREVKPRSVLKKSLVKSPDISLLKEPLAEISGGAPQSGTTVAIRSRSGSLLVKGSESGTGSELRPEPEIAPDPGPGSRSRSGARRTSIAPSTRNFVRRRAGDACEYQGPEGQRCGSRFQTQMDHVIPLALGGTNDVTNLRLLCRTHNLLMAEKTIGLNKMSQFRKPF